MSLSARRLERRSGGGRLIPVAARFTLGPGKEAPYVSALLCERVLQEGDGSLSAIRLIDQVNLAPIPHGLPPNVEIIPAVLTATLLVSLKGGKEGVLHRLAIRVHSPSGATQAMTPQRVRMGSTIPGAVPGANVIIQLQASLKTEGIYWFEVRLDGRRATAIPLRVAFAPRASAGAASQESASQSAARPPRKAERSKAKPSVRRQRSTNTR